jgi:hypothetical protein
MIFSFVVCCWLVENNGYLMVWPKLATCSLPPEIFETIVFLWVLWFFCLLILFQAKQLLMQNSANTSFFEYMRRLDWKTNGRYRRWTANGHFFHANWAHYLYMRNPPLKAASFFGDVTGRCQTKPRTSRFLFAGCFKGVSELAVSQQITTQRPYALKRRF